MAPPAWGKTRLLVNHLERGHHLWIFLSPLRALAEEFYKNCQHIKSRHLIQRRGDWKDVYRGRRGTPTLIVTTPECLVEERVEELAQGGQVCIIVDEFHLFYLWGESFRPVMWESLLALSCRGFSFIALSATMNQDIQARWKRDFLLAFDLLVAIDVGNGRFKHSPDRVHYFSPWGRRMLERRFLSVMVSHKQGGRGTVLLFCRYRRQVDGWLAFCRKRGIRAVGCKGGEVDRFIEEMGSLNRPPELIVSTTALSHGVNLPSIHKVFLSYKVESEDFWLQMATRGGRRGEGFEIYTLDSYHNTLWKCAWSLLLNALWDGIVRLHLLVRML